MEDLITPDLLPDAPQSQSVYDVTYQQNRPLLLIQGFCILSLVILKYLSCFTRYKLKSFQVKVFGSLILTQSLMMHKRMDYSKIWSEQDPKMALDGVLTVFLFFTALLHLLRLNHYMPQSWIGDYQLIAQRVLDQNASLLHLQNMEADIVYENKCSLDEDEYLPPEFEPGMCDSIFTLFDFMVMLMILVIQVMNILTKEGFVDVLNPESNLYTLLKSFGLTKSMSLIVLFSVVYINQSKYVGICKMDAYQYLLIRVMPFLIFFVLLWRYDYSGGLKYHFEQLLLVIFYLAYFIFSDYHNSRKNQLALYFDETFNSGFFDEEFEAKYAKKEQSHVVLIVYRRDGRGGIQGIIVDSFYMDSDGRIANEFYVVVDSEEGVIQKLEPEHLYKLEDGEQIQKAFYQYFLL